MPLCPNGHTFLALIMGHYSFSCGNPARPRPIENTSLALLGSQTGILEIRRGRGVNDFGIQIA